MRAATSNGRARLATGASSLFLNHPEHTTTPLPMSLRAELTGGRSQVHRRRRRRTFSSCCVLVAREGATWLAAGAALRLGDVGHDLVHVRAAATPRDLSALAAWSGTAHRALLHVVDPLEAGPVDPGCSCPDKGTPGGMSLATRVTPFADRGWLRPCGCGSWKPPMRSSFSPL